MKTLIWLLPLLLLACSSKPEKTLRLEESEMMEEFETPAESQRAPAKSSAKKSQENISGQGKDCRSPVGFIAHGQSMNFYRYSRVPEGTDCEKESRTCNDGELSGTFTFASCRATP